jgi:hypothetical protein
MRSFDGISFWWALIMLGALALFFGARTALGWVRVRGDASDDYDYKKGQGMVPDGLPREAYERIYKRVYGPRGPAHVAAGALAILVLTPVVMFAFEAFLNLMYNLSGQSRVIEPGYLVWQFFIFFGLIATWVGIGYAASRRYHQTAPGNLQYEIDQHLYGGEDFGDEL